MLFITAILIVIYFAVNAILGLLVSIQYKSKKIKIPYNQFLLHAGYGWGKYEIHYSDNKLLGIEILEKIYIVKKIAIVNSIHTVVICACLIVLLFNGNNLHSFKHSDTLTGLTFNSALAGIELIGFLFIMAFVLLVSLLFMFFTSFLPYIICKLIEKKIIANQLISHPTTIIS